MNVTTCSNVHLLWPRTFSPFGGHWLSHLRTNDNCTIFFSHAQRTQSCWVPSLCLAPHLLPSLGTFSGKGALRIHLWIQSLQAPTCQYFVQEWCGRGLPSLENWRWEPNRYYYGNTKLLRPTPLPYLSAGLRSTWPQQECGYPRETPECSQLAQIQSWRPRNPPQQHWDHYLQGPHINTGP